MPPYVIGQAIIFCPVVSYAALRHKKSLWFLSIFLSFYLSISFSSPNISRRPSANLECRSEMYRTRFAGIAGRKKSPSRHRRTNLSSYIFATKARIDNRKKLLNSSTSPTCSHNMVNFGPPAAEICWRVWSTPANFNGFRVLAALLHGTLVVSVSQTLRRRTEGAIYIQQGGHHVGH